MSKPVDAGKKLTKAQMAALKIILRDDAQWVRRRTAKGLLRFGFIKYRDSGCSSLVWCRSTKAGRAALSEERK